MRIESLVKRAVVLTLGVTLGTSAMANESSKSNQEVDELRDTLVGVMQALVQKGLITNEQAQAIVADAQAKTQARAKANAEQEASEKDAVHVTYVPQIVRDEISKQVSEEVTPTVTNNVIEQAKKDKWGVPGALPEWVSRFKFSGDIRFRAEYDNFADDNDPNTYLNYLAVNNAGSVTKAGVNAFLNTTEDRLRERIRLRLGVGVQITDGITAGIRLTTGSLAEPVITNQTLGQMGNRYPLGVDQAYLRYDAPSKINLPWLTLSFGRMPNPWVYSDLLWDDDLQFEGFASTFRYAFGNNTLAPNAFLTAGAFPLQEIELSTKDKWLFGGQVGFNMPWDNGGKATLAAGYYSYSHITGQRNDHANPTLLNFTAPVYLQKGNTVFDISADPASQLYALAADYKEMDIIAIVNVPAFNHLLTVTADYVTNLGYDQSKVLAQSGFTSIDQVTDPVQKLAFDKMTTGYQVEFGFGSKEVGKRGTWHAALGYKYLERDAVVDAFTDSDFHFGGTGAKGYILRADWWFRDRTWLDLRYFSADEIAHTGPAYFDSQQNSYIIPTDTPRFGVDILMLDINAQF
jgi:Putative porin